MSNRPPFEPRDITPPNGRCDVAWLALHYQNENCHADGKIPYGLGEDALEWRAQMLAAAKRLGKGAREADVQVIHVRAVTEPGQWEVIDNCPIFGVFREQSAWPRGSWGADLIEGLGAEDGDIDVEHGRNSAFYGSRLEAHMQRLQPKWLIISGVSTAYVVETTVRDAADIGYNIVVAHDACSTFRRDFHEASLRAMSMLARVASADDIVTALKGPGLESLPFELREIPNES